MPPAAILFSAATAVALFAVMIAMSPPRTAVQAPLDPPALFLRPNLYFGTRSADPAEPSASVMTGLLYQSSHGLRHECRMEDRLRGLAYQRNDAAGFGQQVLREADFEVSTALVPCGDADGQWCARIEVTAQEDIQQFLLAYYLGIRGGGRVTQAAPVNATRVTLRATAGPPLHVVTARTDNDLTVVYSEEPAWRARQAVEGRKLSQDPSRPDTRLAYAAVQMDTIPAGQSVALYLTYGETALVGSEIDAAIEAHAAKFDERLAQTFSVKGPHGECARDALSSLFGSIGYFYGDWVVAGEDKMRPAHPLVSAVPSRSFFPRGFLWDEGFHQLAVAQWDPVLSMRILRSWLDTADANGWIAREQILGAEARSKVPQEFVPQHQTHANPPTLFMAIEQLARREDAREWLGAIEPALERHYRWLVSTQAAEDGKGFRWRGRTADIAANITHTLASGLDDYPRARTISDSERHLDLYCWIIVATRAMAAVERGLGNTYKATRYEAELANLEAGLDKLHRDDDTGLYFDRGADGLVRDVFGYVNLFPLIVGVGSSHASTIQRLERGGLVSDAGVRSLEPSSRHYGEGEDYWRGDIWVNINYLVVRALQREGHAALADRIRAALVGNVCAEYARTGWFWERYSAAKGAGKGAHPFTGWTGLVGLLA